jgi:spore germination protein KC
LWKKIQGNWNEQFAELEVNVKVDSFIRREGIRTKPFWSNLNK